MTFTVKEYTLDNTVGGESVRSAAKRLQAGVSELDRLWALDEGGIKAIGVLSLRRGKVVIKGVYGEIDYAYLDLMNRVLLNACTMLNDITVRVDEVSEYWAQFGFKEIDGGMEILNRDIKFCNH